MNIDLAANGFFANGKRVTEAVINNGDLEKSINDNVLIIKVSNAFKNQRYRLNCTLLKNSDVYWFGTMIIKHKNKFYF